MSCKEPQHLKPDRYSNKHYYIHECGDFLFVYNNLHFEDSAEYCKSKNSKLAKINIKNSIVEEKDFKQFINKLAGIIYKDGPYFRIGLKFVNKNGTWYGQWLDGKKYDEKSVEDYYKDKNDSCYEVAVNARWKSEPRVYRVKCGVERYFMCRKPRNVALTSFTQLSSAEPKATTPSYSSKSLRNSSFTTTTTTKYDENYTKTKFILSSSTITSKPTSFLNIDGSTVEFLNNKTLLIGMGSALCLLFIFSLVVLAYIGHIKRKKRSNKNKKKQKIKMSKIRNSRVCERKFYDVTTNKEFKNDVKSAVGGNAALLLTSCDVCRNDVIITHDVCHDEVTLNKVTSKTNDVTTDGSLKLVSEFELDDNVASLPISCDFGRSDIIIKRDAGNNDVIDATEADCNDVIMSCNPDRKEVSKLLTTENDNESVNLSQDFSFWVHVDE